MTDLDDLLAEGRQLEADIRIDCRNLRLAGTFTAGFGGCSLKVGAPCSRVSDWTERVSALIGHADLELAALPTRRRKSLETDSGYAARCLKERLAALDHVLSS
jgi:hypothetical protein